MCQNEITDLLFGGGAGGGKTHFGCSFSIFLCLKYAGIRGVIGRETLKRLKETTLETFFAVAREWGLRPNVHFRYNKMDNIISFWNGSEIFLKELKYKPSDPNFDDLGSLEISFAFIDEVNQIVFRAYEVLRTRIRYKLNEFKIKPKLLMSCNPAKNWVKKEFQKPWKDGTLAPHKAFVQSLAQDNKHLPSSYIESLQNMRDQNLKERLLHGNWDYDDDPSAWFGYDTILDLFKTKTEESKLKFVSGDVSRKGRDRFPLGYWEGLQLKKVFFIPDDIRANHKLAAQWIEKHILNPYGVRRSNCILDEDGLGGGIIDILGCKGFLNGSSPIVPHGKKNRPNFLNLKSQCYWELSELALEGKVGIDEDAMNPTEQEILTEELQQIKQENIDKDGKIQCTPKEKIKENINRSPDLSDMVMMRMYYHLKPATNLKPYFV